MNDSYASSLRAFVGKQTLILPGVRALLVTHQNAVLMQKRSDTKNWGLPGGALEVGETAMEALRREVLEETGLIVRHAEPMALYSGIDQQFTYPNGDKVQPFAMAFIIREWSGTPRPDGEEGTDLHFFPLDALPSDIAPNHRRTLEDFKTYQGRFLLPEY